VGLDQTTTRGNQAVLPNQTVLTAPELDTANPGLVPPKVDDTNPPYTATPAQAVSSGRLAAVTKWAPTGLAVALAALLALYCPGTCSLPTLRLALRGFQGVPGQVVPGHLEG
jgi:hypothetical protein